MSLTQENQHFAAMKLHLKYYKVSIHLSLARKQQEGLLDIGELQIRIPKLVLYLRIATIFVKAVTAFASPAKVSFIYAWDKKIRSN